MNRRLWIQLKDGPRFTLQTWQSGVGEVTYRLRAMGHNLACGKVLVDTRDTATDRAMLQVLNEICNGPRPDVQSHIQNTFYKEYAQRLWEGAQKKLVKHP